MRYDFDSVPFRLMRFKYGVPILFLLMERDEMHQNEIRKALGAEIQPIHDPLEFMVEHGFVHQRTMPRDSRIKHEFSLTPKGRKLTQFLMSCVTQMLAISSEPHPNPGKSK